MRVNSRFIKDITEDIAAAATIKRAAPTERDVK